MTTSELIVFGLRLLNFISGIGVCFVAIALCVFVAIQTDSILPLIVAAPLLSTSLIVLTAVVVGVLFALNGD